MVELTDLSCEAGLEAVLLFPDANVEITLKRPREDGETESE